jgi:peroxiredoxin
MNECSNGYEVVRSGLVGFGWRRPRRWLELVLWLGVLGFVGYRLWPQVSAAVGAGVAGGLAPEIVVETLEGDTVSLVALRGQVVLVNFWATWCPPCRLEMPGFQSVYRSRRDQGFTILALSTDRSGRGVVEEYVEARGLTFPVALATARVERAFGGVGALPTSFLIDRDGRIRHVVRGIFLRPALDQAVDRLLREPAPAPPPAPG